MELKGEGCVELSVIRSEEKEGILSAAPWLSVSQVNVWGWLPGTLSNLLLSESVFRYLGSL